MAQIPGNFNASKHDDMNDFSVIPDGDYIAQVIKSDIKMTKAAVAAKDPAKGQYIVLQISIIQGKYKGKIIFTNLNIINPNPTAVEIAEKELATIARAVGVTGRVQQTEELHGKPMTITVGTETSANYPDKNVVTMYSQAGSSATFSELEPVSSSDDARANDSHSDDTQQKKMPWDE